MRFTHTSEQLDFARSLDKLLAGAGTTAAARSWATGSYDAGLAIWRSLAEQGVPALLVPEGAGGAGATPVELAIAFEALGRRVVPGPYVESAAYLPAVLDGEPLARLAEGEVATVAVAPHTPYALDAEASEAVYVVQGGSSLQLATVSGSKTSVDPTRRLGIVEPTGDGRDLSNDAGRLAFDLAVLATSAQLLGLGERVLADSVAYVQQRRQFGRAIGSYQAVKHQLADVRIALDFARPLIEAAAVQFESPHASRDVSAAKVAAADAAYLASRVGLQLHGAVGYTAELDLSLWLLKVRALVAAWGTPTWHRERIAQALGRGER